MEGRHSRGRRPSLMKLDQSVDDQNGDGSEVAVLLRLEPNSEGGWSREGNSALVRSEIRRSDFREPSFKATTVSIRRTTAAGSAVARPPRKVRWSVGQTENRI